MNGATRHVNDWNARLRFPIRAEIVGKSHGAGRVAGHGMDAPESRARPGGNDGPGLWRETRYPPSRWNWLTRRAVEAERRPGAFLILRLVRDRSFNNED